MSFFCPSTISKQRAVAHKSLSLLVKLFPSPQPPQEFQLMNVLTYVRVSQTGSPVLSLFSMHVSPARLATSVEDLCAASVATGQTGLHSAHWRTHFAAAAAADYTGQVPGTAAHLHNRKRREPQQSDSNM